MSAQEEYIPREKITLDCRKCREFISCLECCSAMISQYIWCDDMFRYFRSDKANLAELSEIKEEQPEGYLYKKLCDMREDLIEISISSDNKTIWINNRHQCVVRVCGIDEMIFNLDEKRMNIQEIKNVLASHRR